MKISEPPEQETKAKAGPGADPLHLLYEIVLELEGMPEGPEKDAALERLSQIVPPEMVQEQKAAVLALLAREESPEGFAGFYRLIHGIEMPRHNMRQVRAMFKAHGEGVGFLGFAWRGSWKTTTLNATFNAWLLGLHPEGTGLIVGANDDSAEKVTKAMAAIIEYHPAWALVFPKVRPNTDKGWSVEGYWVWDTGYEISAWVQQQSAKVDPSFVGGGWGSSRLIGKHPSLFLTIDDIHDRENSTSARTRGAVVDTLLRTILKTVIREADKLVTWLHMIGTPWADDDAYHVAKASGQFDFMSVPAMTKAAPNAPGAVYIDGVNKRNGAIYEDIIGWWYLEWPERFGVESIIAERSYGKAAFWQMIMLDLAQSKTSGLRYYLYDHTKIDPTWIHGAGCDFATVLDNRPDPGRDLFSTAIGAKTPYNQIVIVGGILEQLTQARAEEYLANLHLRYPNFRYTVMEGDGAGEQFYLSLVRRHPEAKITMRKTGGKPKRERQERELGVWLEEGNILISDAESPYLMALRKAFDDFPDGNNDVRDGAYWLAHAFLECLGQIVAPLAALAAQQLRRNSTTRKALSFGELRPR